MALFDRIPENTQNGNLVPTINKIMEQMDKILGQILKDIEDLKDN